jgi:parvulin-like peptidyl-prolyl isomerase
MRVVPRVLAAALAASLMAACAGGGEAARVSGASIADQEVATAAGVFLAVAGLAGSPCGTQEGDGDTVQAACNRFALQSLIGFSAAEDYGAANDVAVTDQELQEVADGFTAQFADGALETALQEEAVTYDDFLGVLRASLLQQEVADALVAETVSEEELRRTYEDELGDHVIVQVDHILVQTKEEADDVYAQVTAPGATREDFLALAEELSIDPSVAENGGALGSTQASAFTASFQEAVLAMDEGDISEPVQTEFGWHVIHLNGEQVETFEDVRPDLVARLGGPAFAEHVRALIADDQIDVNPRYGRLDPQTLSVVRITSTDPVGTGAPTPVNVAPEG